MATETRTILVAGPDPDLLDIVSHRLRMLGFHVRQAHSLYEALACTERQPIDLAIVDLELPAVGGRSLIARLTDAPYALRVLVLVDPHDAASYERAVEEGAYRCLARFRCHRELDHLVEESLDAHHAPAVAATLDWQAVRTPT
ncbi:MAG: response regulator [Pirellulales bacterium]